MPQYLFSALAFGALIGLSLGLVGGGGSILTVPVLVYAIGQPPHAATTTSLAIVGLNALFGMAGHMRAGNVQPRTGLVFGVLGIAGALIGTWLNKLVPGNVLLVLFAVVMLIAAVAMLRRAGDSDQSPHRKDPATSPGWFKLLAAGTGVGLMTGFFGVGGGFVIVPALVLILALPMRIAIGTSLLVIAVNSASSLAARLIVVGIGSGAPRMVRLTLGGLDLGLTALFVVGGLAGILLGVRLAGKFSPARLTRTFAGLIVLVALYVLARSAGLLA